MMTETLHADRLYALWFSRYPEIQNPTDINRKCKLDFATEIGFENLRVMQAARKQASKERGVNLFVFPSFWTIANLQRYGFERLDP